MRIEPFPLSFRSAPWTLLVVPMLVLLFLLPATAAGPAYRTPGTMTERDFNTLLTMPSKPLRPDLPAAEAPLIVLVWDSCSYCNKLYRWVEQNRKNILFQVLYIPVVWDDARVREALHTLGKPDLKGAARNKILRQLDRAGDIFAKACGARATPTFAWRNPDGTFGVETGGEGADFAEMMNTLNADAAAKLGVKARKLTTPRGAF
ncbi:MAG: thioredoxin family protein [Methylobacteriaceae bacterium]|jgi:hypothetical protein|nr:thioredoxin family protein [Methylobacteriaceae bacterium]